MTHREAYVFGWVYGRICSADWSLKKDPNRAAERPYSGSAKIIALANQKGILTDELDQEIGKALCEITSIDLPGSGGEAMQPLEIQGSWQLGYFHGLGGKPLPKEDMDIKARRLAKGMTQAQLAAKLGIDQAIISRWEKGKVKPTEDSLAKLKEVLS